MKNLLLILGLSLTLISCKKEVKTTDFSLFEQMIASEQAEQIFRPRKKATVPFFANQIYDPFINKSKGLNTKFSYEKGLWTQLKITVIDTLTCQIDVKSRNSRKPKLRKAFPVLITNNSKAETMALPIHRGSAKIVQEALNSKNEWIAIENFTQEKMGESFYMILPNEYVYTKIPIYYGKDTTQFRLGLVLDDTTFYSNIYRSTIQKWMLR